MLLYASSAPKLLPFPARARAAQAVGVARERARSLRQRGQSASQPVSQAARAVGVAPGGVSARRQSADDAGAQSTVDERLALI